MANIGIGKGQDGEFYFHYRPNEKNKHNENDEYKKVNISDLELDELRHGILTKDQIQKILKKK